MPFQISQEMIFGFCLFTTVAVLAYAMSGAVFRKDPVAKRLRAQHDADPVHEKQKLPGGAGTSATSATSATVVPVMERIGAVAARPFMPRSAVKQSTLRKQLMHAGIYSSQAMEVIVGLKVILLGAGMVMGYLIGALIGGMAVFVFLYVGAVFGYMMPAMWLKSKVRKRRRALDAALPDALDLMVVCVESGLTLDAALFRVGQEISLAHPDISKEFGITHMETRVGLSRVDALRNLGQRTGCASLQSLAAMLVQTERFGTSIAQALRVHAEGLRVKRQHAAEEQAAKTTVKLAFPVVLFIFPTLIVVLGGPAFILLFKSPLFTR
ncbi:MAG: tight adherence protein [Phycisphaerales bacterium]|nr:tight adherence protein [Phycisphaerales bacterium]